MPPSVCPNCGSEVPRNARACPECGSDEQTGWSEEAKSTDLGLPDEDFNYDKFVEQEFGSKKPVPRGIHWFWWVIALVLIIGFVVFALR
jgi:uncharacterized membrane protein YvbJ